MNNFEYENQLGTVNLVYRIQPQEEVDTFVLGMLCNNDIRGVAKTIFTQIDSEKIVKYNVSSKISVSRFFDGAVNKKRLLGVFSGIIDAMLSVEEYMIDQRALLLDLDYIFTDVSTYDTVMICLPLVHDGEESDLDMKVFFKNVIFSTKFDQAENCDHVAQMLNYLNSNPVLSLIDFKKLLDELSKSQESVKPAQPTVAAHKPVRVSVPEPVPQPVVAAVPAPQCSGVVDYPNPQTTAGTGQSVSNPTILITDNEKPSKAVEEKTMSMLYLLRHYSKENVAVYKAQKEKKKEKETSTSKSKQPVAVQTQLNPGFAVPGQQPTAPQPVARPEPTGMAQPAVTRKNGISGNQHIVKTEPVAPINFGETTVLGGGQIGETTVLGAESNTVKANPHLIRMKNNEKILLNKPVFRIGKERSYVDYFIADNTAISRSHANIVNHNGEFCVVDTNSTNHTYVNGGMIQSNVETKLAHGAKIRLANEDFEFRLY